MSNPTDAMDLGNYWQENKRFVLSVAGGLVVFAIGSMLIDSFFRNELARERRSADSIARKLKSEPMYTQSDLAAAQTENEALRQAVEVLEDAVQFAPRRDFALDAARGGASNQYFATVSRVREELLTLAGRANLRLPEDLGLPALSPTRESEIARYLEALDLVDRAVRVAIAAGIERIDRIEMKLDPKLASREGVGFVESTRVEFTLSGRPGPIVRFLEDTQASAHDAAVPSGASASVRDQTRDPGAPRAGTDATATGPLLIEKAQMQPARTKTDEVGLEVTFVVARVQPS